MKTFTAYRRLDISETHTELQRNDPSEPQYEGIVFTDGTCAIRWLTPIHSTSVWQSFDDMYKIHGHPEYGTEIIWHNEK